MDTARQFPISREDTDKEVKSTKTKLRSIAGHMPITNFDYVAGKRVGPEPKLYPVNNSKDDMIRLQRKRYILWSMLRNASPST